MGQFETIYSVCTFTMVASAESMLIICIMVLVDELWYLGIFLITLVIFQIFLICVAGTLFESVCSAYEERVYFMLWYNLNTSQQKVVRSMLQMAQKPILVTLLGFVPANLDTFKRVGLIRENTSTDLKNDTLFQVMKSTYSFLMLLHENVN